MDSLLLPVATCACKRHSAGLVRLSVAQAHSLATRVSHTSVCTVQRCSCLTPSRVLLGAVAAVPWYTTETSFTAVCCQSLANRRLVYGLASRALPFSVVINSSYDFRHVPTRGPRQQGRCYKLGYAVDWQESGYKVSVYNSEHFP